MAVGRFFFLIEFKVFSYNFQKKLHDIGWIRNSEISKLDPDPVRYIIHVLKQNYWLKMFNLCTIIARMLVFEPPATLPLWPAMYYLVL